MLILYHSLRTSMSHTFDVMLNKHTIIILIIIVLCTQKSILFAPNISFHTLYAYTFAFRYICNDMKINMVYNIHCYISIYYNQNSCFLLSFKFFYKN